MPEIDIEMLVDQLTLIGLVSREQYREARAEADEWSGDALVRVLMRKGWLTSWQLERLKKGDPSGFFFGDYRALFHLAEGTFARVYRGEHNEHAARRWRSRCCATGSSRSPRRCCGSTRKPRPGCGCATPTSSRSSIRGSRTTAIS